MGIVGLPCTVSTRDSLLPSSPWLPSVWLHPPPRWWQSLTSTLAQPPDPSHLLSEIWSPHPKVTDLWLWRGSPRTSTRTGLWFVRVCSQYFYFSFKGLLIPSARPCLLFTLPSLLPQPS